MTRNLFWMLGLLIAAATTPAIHAEPVAAPDAAGETSEASIQKWIADLDSGDFKVREQATRALLEQGADAIEAVAKAATGESLEVTSRAIDILRQLMQREDAETSAAAKKALERLAASEHRNAARRASAILNPPQPEAEQPLAPMGGVIQIQNIQVRAGGGVRIQVRENNGHRVVEATEGDRTVRIETSPQGQVKMKVTEKVDGKDKITEYEAADAKELEKKHPEAAELVKKYSGQAAVGQVRINGANIQFGFGGPPGVPAPRVRPMLVPQQALDQLQQANRRLEESLERAKKLAEENAAFKPLVEELEKARQELEAARRQFQP